jgi:hypothetical protein
MLNFTRLILLLTLTTFFYSCKKSDTSNNTVPNSFKINADEYTLANAFYALDSANEFTYLVLTSPSLSYNPSIFDFSGTGNFIAFDISDITATLRAGNYYNPIGFYSSIALNYSTSIPPTTIEYEINDALPGTLNITKSNSTYTIKYEYTLTTGQLVKGQFVGPVQKVRL